MQALRRAAGGEAGQVGAPGLRGQGVRPLEHLAGLRTVVQALGREDVGLEGAAAEQALIAEAVRAGRAVIGVCLGSQLIGEALGARHVHSPEKEIGKFRPP